jgi:hypothetical protein
MFPAFFSPLIESLNIKAKFLSWDSDSAFGLDYF